MSRSAETGRRKSGMRTIAIVGCGQIGGSLVLAFRKSKLPCQIIGIDTSRKRLRLLSQKLDRASTRWETAKEANLVFVCLHFGDTVRFLKQASRNQLIVDVCSTKKELLSLANRLELRYIGGHPLCGNERTGEKGWEVDLFRNILFFLCPSSQSLPSDRSFLDTLIRKLGAKPTQVDAALHDECLAATSHFPAFLSKILEETTRSIPPSFKGPGHRSMTRLGKTSPELLQTFLASNRNQIIKAARQFRINLDHWIKNHKTPR